RTTISRWSRIGSATSGPPQRTSNGRVAMRCAGRSSAARAPGASLGSSRATGPASTSSVAPSAPPDGRPEAPLSDTGCMNKTEVAVGIVFREDGQVLIGQRLVGKPYAGWWEFPGGKFEPGESAAEALARELDEELGVQVLESRPWVV